MKIYLVVDQPKSWPLKIPGVEVVAAREYLTNPEYATDDRRTRVYNCCRSYKYQSRGYYVSLLATARGHQVLPDIGTVQGLRSTDMVRLAATDLDEDIQHSLRKIQSDTFTLAIYFGRNLAKIHEELAAKLFALFPSPFLQAEFQRDGRWHLKDLEVMGAKEIPESHHAFAVAAAQDHFDRRRPRPKRYAYDLAILVNDEDRSPPSDRKALEHFAEAARRHDLRPTFIGKDDFGKLSQFDALFIRETTAVNHHTFRFAQAAAAKGLVVIDDPESIIRCTNKVYLAEVLSRAKIPAPKTLVVSKDNADEVADVLGLPTVLKQPDSSFSQGVFKADTREELAELLDKLLDESDLVIAQAFTPTDYDWRIGLIDGEPLYACRYHMARGHWQVYQTDANGTQESGSWDTLPIEKAPSQVVKVATRAADLIGSGFYGVDLKEHNGKVVVIEVNDNPSVEDGVEDQVLGRKLYDRIMHTFRQRLDGDPKERNQ